MTTDKTDLEKIPDPGIGQKGYLSELFNFACVLRGEVKHLEKIKEYIVQEYVDTGLVKLIRLGSIYQKNVYCGIFPQPKIHSIRRNTTHPLE